MLVLSQALFLLLLLRLLFLLRTSSGGLDSSPDCPQAEDTTISEKSFGLGLRQVAALLGLRLWVC